MWGPLWILWLKTTVFLPSLAASLIQFCGTGIYDSIVNKLTHQAISTVWKSDVTPFRLGSNFAWYILEKVFNFCFAWFVPLFHGIGMTQVSPTQIWRSHESLGGLKGEYFKCLNVTSKVLCWPSSKACPMLELLGGVTVETFPPPFARSEVSFKEMLQKLFKKQLP